jgi:hypothetical protein
MAIYTYSDERIELAIGKVKRFRARYCAISGLLFAISCSLYFLAQKREVFSNPTLRSLIFASFWLFLFPMVLLISNGTGRTEKIRDSLSNGRLLFRTRKFALQGLLESES